MPGAAAPAGDRRTELKAAFDLLHQGGFEQARQRLAPIVRHGDLEGLLLYGLALGGCGAGDAAAPLLVEVAAARPASLHPCLDLLTLLQRQFRGRDAEPVFLACLKLAPGDWRLQLAHAQLLTELQRYDEAIGPIERTLTLQPRSYPALNQKAIILIGQRRLQEGIALFRRIVAEDPGNAPAWANLGCTLAAEGVFEEALDAYRRSIQLKPGEPQVRLNHSICLLKAGRMTQGWHEHEWRFRIPGHTELPLDRILPTIGRDSRLDGKSVLVTCEEGAGDTLMFLRYVPLLARLGAEVVVWVPPNLARLVARVEGVAGVVATPDVHFGSDWHCPFISLPRAFSASTTPWGVAAPYLDTDPAEVARAAAVLAGRAGPPSAALRVGLAWGGAPRPENLAANMVDAKRSIGLAALAPLARLRHVELISLQFGPYAEELRRPPVGLEIADPMSMVADMDDTASLVRNLDVVVSVDTSIVHLAGGLGVRTILLDRYDNCWRWFHDRNDSPWYPTLSIIRQTAPGAWDGVVQRLVPMLQAMADAKRGARRRGRAA